MCFFFSACLCLMRQDLDVFQDSLERRERGIIDTFVHGKLLLIEVTVGLEA